MIADATRAAAERARGVVISGSAGVGKTRLAREAVDGCGPRSAHRHWIVGTASARSVPLGAFADIASDFGPDPLRRVREVIDGLIAGSQDGEVIVGVDDAHLLDDLSAFTVHQLVTRGLATVILTIRSGEAPPDAITAIWKDHHLERLELQPLALAETSQPGRTRTRWPGALPVCAPSLATHPRQRALPTPPARQRSQCRQDRTPIGYVAVGRTAGALAHARRARRRPDRPGTHVRPRCSRCSRGRASRWMPIYWATSPGRKPSQRPNPSVWCAWIPARTRGGAGWRIPCSERFAAPARCGCGDCVGASPRNSPEKAQQTRETCAARGAHIESDLAPDPELLLAAASSAMQLSDLRLAEALAEHAVAAGGGLHAQIAHATTIIWQQRGADAETILVELADPTSGPRADSDCDHSRHELLGDSWSTSKGRRRTRGAARRR